jgi:hypothetical protein
MHRRAGTLQVSIIALFFRDIASDISAADVAFLIHRSGSG